jgi:tRNA G18 (ribose-2'-O)-methylase SpoU
MGREIIETEIRQCVRVECDLRYPRPSGSRVGERCPRCGATTHLIQRIPLNREGNQGPISPASIHLEALLDNIRSAWNVGSMFRTADGLGIRHLHLCGITPTPDSSKVSKTSLGAEQSVGWSHHHNGVRAATQLIEHGKELWGLECTPGAASILQPGNLSCSRPVVLVVGNEISGVDPGILELCKRILFVPMLGKKGSFNVAVVFGIAAYAIATAVSKSPPMDRAADSPTPG